MPIIMQWDLSVPSSSNSSGTTSFRRLTLTTSGWYSRLTLENMLKPVIEITTLEQLDVILCPHSMRDLDLVARVVARNANLRRVSVTCGTGPGPLTMEDYHNTRFMDPGRTAERMQPWLSALRNTSSLTRLTLDLLCFAEEECCDFFRAVAAARSLQDVRVRNVPPSASLRNICQTVRDCGLTDTVVVESYYLSAANAAALPECPEVKAVTIHSAYFPNARSLCWVLDVLAKCPQIVSVCITLRHREFEDSVHEAVARYLAGAPSNLERIDIRTPDDLYDWMEPQAPNTGSALIRALSFNLRLRAIALSVLRLSERDSVMLAQAAVQSRMLERVSLSTTYGLTSAAFIQNLAPCMANNYHLLHVGYSGMSRPPPLDEAVVQRVTARNRGLVERAALFVLGRRNRDCACALEVASQHPGVAEIVQEQAVVGATEAESMVRLAVQSLGSLHNFMKVTGVVKHAVQCCAPAEGVTQLDDLTEDAWWHVRKYLKVADVRPA